MKEMSINNLIEYIKHAIELESGIMTQEQVITQYEKISNSKKPELNLLPMPTRQYAEYTPETEEAKVIRLIAYALGGAFAVSGLAICASASLGTGLICIILGISVFIFYHMKNREQEKQQVEQNKYYEENYNNERQRILNENEKRQSAYNKNYADWEFSNHEAMNKLNQPLKELKASMIKYYSLDIIFPKYHNLPALTSIYEYLTSGRCEKLTGPDGAYNLYESELRQNTIVSQLNVIISNLEQIRQNQYTLYQEMVKMNSNVQLIVRELDEIRSYTYTLTELSALNTVYTGIAASSASAMAFYTAIA